MNSISGFVALVAATMLSGCTGLHQGGNMVFAVVGLGLCFALAVAFLRGSGLIRVKRCWIGFIAAVAAAAAWGVADLADGATPRFYPPYSVEEMLEAEAYLEKVYHIGGKTRHVDLPGWVDSQVVEGDISDYCGRYVGRVAACVATSEGVMYLGRYARMSTYLHELAHLRDFWIESKTLEQTHNHIGWHRSK